MNIQLALGDALMIVDVQNDFLVGGSLAVAKGDVIIPVLNHYIARFQSYQLPIFATRDWHPLDHCSFQTQGGPWPPHCIAGSPGAAFPSGLELPADVNIISKATSRETDVYSGFTGTRLNGFLQSLHIHQIFIGGLATEYCVRNTVNDALCLGYTIFILEDAIQAINQKPEDGQRALEDMLHRGAKLVHYEELV